MKNTYQLEESIAQAEEVFKGIIHFVTDSPSTEPHRVEEEVMKRVLELGKHVMQAYFNKVGAGDVGKEIINAKGEVLKQYRIRAIDYISIFGKVKASRWYYWARKEGGICPLDGALNMPERAYSYYLQEIITLLNVRDTYDESAMLLDKLYGLKISPRSIMDILLDVSESVEAFRDTQPPPCPSEEKEVLVVSVDGKGVPMRREHTAEKKTRLKKGEKRQSKKMSAIGAIYSIEKHPRSAEDIVGEPTQERSETPLPRPCAKRVRAKLANKEELMAKLQREAGLRDKGECTTKVFLCDGERQLWKLKENYFGEYIGVLDIYHVMEKIWAYAYCFHPEGSRSAESFVRERLRLLLEGRVYECIGQMVAVCDSRRVSALKKQSVLRIAGYFKRNASRMQYDRYLSMGIPIGSGNVESACKNLVKDRMEGAGMRWSTQGASAMLALRAVYLNGDLHEYFEHHVEKQRKKVYGEHQNWQPHTGERQQSQSSTGEKKCKSLQLVA